MSNSTDTTPRQDPDKKSGELQGEGNYDAARQYQKSAAHFVAAGKVDKAAKDATPDNAAQAQEMKDAEKSGRAHAKE